VIVMMMDQMMSSLSPSFAPVWSLALSGGGGGGGEGGSALGVLASLKEVPLSAMVWLIPGLPLLGALLAGLCAVLKVRSKLPAWLMVLCLAGSFAVTFWMYQQVAATGGSTFAVVHLFDWINFNWAPGKAFVANFSLYVDPLTCLWMLFVTGLAACIALYASEYMSHDVGPGYCRFFFAFGLFVFSMACLVMGDNLLLLYLGWEGVGLCSYLLIGYFYQKPSAVAAAKKAFILNRIGDLGLALAIMLIFVKFGTIEYAKLWPMLTQYLQMAAAGQFDQIPTSVQLIAVLLTLAAFGKSAQLPLYVWLPDAMEGPTPVSALIHAATMVTAGVYLIARTLPLFQISVAPLAGLEGTWFGFVSQISALEIVAYGGGLTALLAATIGMAQFDIKRIMAYSTVSQLGFMFAGLGVLASYGAAFHVFTHAFFKATLFLACGAVMHGFAGQLDLRKLSGVMWMKGWLIVGLAMLVGCLNLAGVPFTAGYFSKDVILAEAFSVGHFRPLAWILLFTALLTAYYTFRVFFRVFVGPKHYEPGDELHAHDDHGHDHGHGDKHDHGHDAKGHDAKAHFHPHPPGWAINTVLALLAIASIAAAFAYPTYFVKGLVDTSTAQVAAGAAGHTHVGGATIFGYDPHKAMYYISGIVGAVGIITAFFLHYLGRRTAATSAADNLNLGALQRAAQNKWYVDEFYNFTIRLPLKVLSHIFHMLDKLVVDGLVNLAGLLPRAGGAGLRPSQSGVLHGYAVAMAAGIGVLGLVALLALR
jgi:NADH-quinone oxidoreductase subunit L